MSEYTYFTLREKPELKEAAAEWFHNKWGIPKEAYLECMEDCLDGKSDYDWYLCLDKGEIVGGLGIIDNDFHVRKDLRPNVCAVYTEDAYRSQGIAGTLLWMAAADMKSKGISNQERMHLFIVLAMSMIAGILLCADIAMVMA